MYANSSRSRRPRQDSRLARTEQHRGGESRGGSSARDVILAERKGGFRHGMLTRLQPSSEASMYLEMKSDDESNGSRAELALNAE